MSPVEQIKERLSIVDVISSYVKLEKAGQHFRARCPFHNEKTPSFFVSPERNTFHCFGCSKGGDIFSFVQEIEGTTFPETIKLLADRAGIKLDTFQPGAPKEDNEMFRTVEYATIFFQKELEKLQDAKEYLHKRGITDSTIKEFRVGYAPNGWRNLHEALTSRGISEASLEKTGLVIKSERGYYDRFRARIMFPIANPQGKIVGFSGRAYPERTDEKDSAKYINSPETPVYNKSKILFGYDKAKRAISGAKQAILVEGQMDLLMAHQAGTKEAVALSGTALTEDHIRLIKRFTEKLILALDADEAGFKATERSVKLALLNGLDVLAVRLPRGLDPADLIKENEESWKKLISHPKHIIEVYIEVLQEEYSDNRTFKKEVEKKVIPYLADIKSPIDKAHFISYIAQVMGVEESVVQETLGSYKQSRNDQTEGKYLNDVVSMESVHESRKEIILKYLTGIMYATETHAPELSKEIKEGMAKLLGGEENIPTYSDEEKNKILFEIEKKYSTEVPKDDAKELLSNLRREVLRDKIIEKTNELHKAERLGDNERSHSLLKEITLLKQEIETLFQT